MALYRQLLDSPILALPPELVLHILSYLQVNDLVHCIPVSKDLFYKLQCGATTTKMFIGII